MISADRNQNYTPAQVSAITGLALPAVHKAIEHRLINAKSLRDGRSVHRMLSKSHLIYLRMEATGLTSLPLASRRQVARAIEQNPALDFMALSEGSVIQIQIKAARKEVDTGLRRLARAVSMVSSDRETMRGEPVYKGTRIPVRAIADMLSQGTAVDEILEGYPALTRDIVELAPMYVRAFPRRGRPAARHWAATLPRRTTSHKSRP